LWCFVVQYAPLAWAVSSVVEHCLHTAGVTGSNPVPPTMLKKPRLLQPGLLFFSGASVTNRRFRPAGDPISFAQPKEIGERKGCPLPRPAATLCYSTNQAAAQLSLAAHKFVSNCGLQTV